MQYLYSIVNYVVNFLINHMEVIKNISLSLVSVSILGGSIFFYIKIPNGIEINEDKKQKIINILNSY